MTSPWDDLTPAQRQQIREAQARQKEKDMTDQITARESGSMAEIRAALKAARAKPTVTLGTDRWQSPPLPAPLGVDCPDHPTYPLVIRDGAAWCRRGQHVVCE